jgi:hypothetical protein
LRVSHSMTLYMEPRSAQAQEGRIDHYFFQSGF